MGVYAHKADACRRGKDGWVLQLTLLGQTTSFPPPLCSVLGCRHLDVLWGRPAGEAEAAKKLK